MVRPARPPLPKVFVVTEERVAQAALFGTFELRGGQPRLLVGIRGARSVADVDPRLVFKSYEECAELRGRAVRFRRVLKPDGQRRSVSEAAIELFTLVGDEPPAAWW